MTTSRSSGSPISTKGVPAATTLAFSSNTRSTRPDAGAFTSLAAHKPFVPLFEYGNVWDLVRLMGPGLALCNHFADGFDYQFRLLLLNKMSASFGDDLPTLRG